MRPFLILCAILLLAVPCWAAPCNCAGGVCQPGAKACAPATIPQVWGWRSEGWEAGRIGTPPAVLPEGTLTVEASAIVERPKPIRRVIHGIRQLIHGKAAAETENGWPPPEFNGPPPLMDKSANLPDITEGPGPMPGPIPGPGPQPFHGGGGQGWRDGGFHGGYYRGPYFNPVPYVMPFIENYATSPRSVLNPMTGQYQMMTPGQWTQPMPGQYVWQPLPVWPLLGDGTPYLSPRERTFVAPGVGSEVDVEGLTPVRHLTGWFKEHKPVRRLIGRIIHRRS